MKIDKTKYQNCTYVFGGVLRPLPLQPIPIGWVEVGGNPASPHGEWVARVTAQKKGFLRGYSIQEDSSYPGDYSEVDRALTLSGARDKVVKRVSDIASFVSEKLGVPVVDFVEAERHKHRADEIAVERMRAECRS